MRRQISPLGVSARGATTQNGKPYLLNRPRHGTKLELDAIGGEVILTVESHVEGKREMGIAMWLTESDVDGLAAWLEKWRASE